MTASINTPTPDWAVKSLAWWRQTIHNGLVEFRSIVQADGSGETTVVLITGPGSERTLHKVSWPALLKVETTVKPVTMLTPIGEPAPADGSITGTPAEPTPPDDKKH